MGLDGGSRLTHRGLNFRDGDVSWVLTVSLVLLVLSEVCSQGSSGGTGSSRSCEGVNSAAWGGGDVLLGRSIQRAHKSLC